MQKKAPDSRENLEPGEIAEEEMSVPQSIWVI